jgi:hypothetical protein
MRRVFLAGGAVGVLLVVGLALAGGLSFRREIDYVECERFSIPFASVLIQSSPVGIGWGNPAFLGFSSYGPPYDLFIVGTLPEGVAADSFALTDLVVEADGAREVSVPRAVVEVEDMVVRQNGAKRPGRGFLYTARAVTSATPARLRVAGTLTPIAPAGAKAQRFAHVFEARRTRRLMLGPWSWNL